MAMPETLKNAAKSFFNDPLGLVKFEYPWGQPGPLEAWNGPDTWQVEVLEALREALVDPRREEALRFAIGSGHGIGKGTLMAWLVRWWITTRPHPQMVITANTQAQLSTKTWRELAKWHRLSVYEPYFEWSQTSYKYVEASDTWYAQAIPWNEAKPEAFQGAHDKYVFLGFDEASAIPDIIWDTTEGSLTTWQCLWVVLGNLTRPQGRFIELFPGGRFQHRWCTWQIDSRRARMANQRQIAQWIEDYGLDSDFVRVRVLGQQPNQAAQQFIGRDLIDLARRREPVDDLLQPHLMGVDVARYGDDRSVILIRHGGNITQRRIFREIDTVRLTGYIAETIDDYPHPLVVFIDGIGIGAGVVDQCRARGYSVIEVQAGSRPQDVRRYLNKRVEMWDTMKQWVQRMGCLAASGGVDDELAAELMGPEYWYDVQGRLHIESKDDMKSRGLASPDEAEALLQTFAAPVSPQIVGRAQPLVAAGVDFDPMRSW